jgi:hypothetical protein
VGEIGLPSVEILGTSVELAFLGGDLIGSHGGRGGMKGV